MLQNNVELDLKTKFIEDGVTQTEVAERIGVSLPYVNRIIRGREQIVNKTFIKILVAQTGFAGGIAMWFWLALGSAVFAALTSILAKVGIEGVGSNLATAIRTMIVVIMAWGMVFITHQQGGIRSISQKSWIFLILSGLATGASWLCYYKALQMGDASKVVPIDKLSVIITLVLAFVFLHEEFTAKSVIGCILIGAGTLLMVL